METRFLSNFWIENEKLWKFFRKAFGVEIGSYPGHSGWILFDIENKKVVDYTSLLPGKYRTYSKDTVYYWGNNGGRPLSYYTFLVSREKPKFEGWKVEGNSRIYEVHSYSKELSAITVDDEDYFLLFSVALGAKIILTPEEEENDN